MSRQVILLGVGLSLIGVAFALTTQILEPPPGPTAANVRRVRMGMTMEQVDAILGPGARPGEGGGAAEGSWMMLSYEWQGPDGRAVVCFDQRGTSPPAVCGAEFHRAPGTGPLDWLCSWFAR